MKRLILSISLSISLSLSLALPALADDPFIGEIRLWPTDDPPAGWLICDGSTLFIDEYPYLFQTINWIYGGYTELENEFNIPDFRGRVPVGWDPSRSEFDGYGETGGEISHTLTINEMPSHRHTTSQIINGAGGVQLLTQAGAAAISSTTNATGGGLPHNNLQPYLTLNFIIYAGGTPTPTPTATLTPTATPTGTVTVTPNTLYLPQVITTTLQSGTVLNVPEEVTFGQIIISGIVVSLLAAFALDFIFRLVYRR